MKTLKLIQKVLKDNIDNEKVYDIEVKNAHHYILKNGIVSHNSMSFIPQNIQAMGCLIPTEEVVTLEGIKCIKDIKKGDKVLSSDGNYHVIEKTWNFEKPTYSFEFTDDRFLTCSTTHRFLINIDNIDNENSWILASELNKGDKIYVLEKDGTYSQVTVNKKSDISNPTNVIDLTVKDTHNYVSANGIINHNSGIVYNASITIELSAAKLEDKANDAAAKARAGSDAGTKNGVLVTAKPVKSRFCRPMKVKFQIPYYKKPNPYVGLEQFMTWENSGVVRGNLIDQKAYDKLSDTEKKKIYTFEFNGETKYVEPKETARGIVVKHLGMQVPVTEFFTETVFTPEFLDYINTNVIHPMFDLPDQSAFDDVAEIENMIEVGEQADEAIKVPGEEFMTPPTDD